MTDWHPAQAKALLRRALEIDGVLTTAQLERRGLSAAANWLGLPRVTYTCRTRVNQSESDRELTFVGRDAEVLFAAPRELMHLAGLAEGRDRLLTVLVGQEWRHVSLAGNLRTQLPDAEVVHPEGLDGAVEFDAGYDRTKRAKKWHGFAVSGYSRIFWLTSIHGRVDRLCDEAWLLHKQGHLPHVLGGEVVFVDFWSVRDPYQNRPRCHKPFRQAFEFGAVAGQ